MNYTGVLEVSIRAYYENGHESTYYREMELKDLAQWLEAHTYTHPSVSAYSIIVKRKEIK